DERRIGRVTQPKPCQALFIVCIGLSRRSLKLRRTGKPLQLGKKIDEVKHIDRLAIVRLSPWAKTGYKILNLLLGQWQLFDHRQISIDLCVSELTRSLRMPGPEGHVQDHQRSGKNEFKPHFQFLS